MTVRLFLCLVWCLYQRYLNGITELTVSTLKSLGSSGSEIYCVLICPNIFWKIFLPRSTYCVTTVCLGPAKDWHSSASWNGSKPGSGFLRVIHISIKKIYSSWLKLVRTLGSLKKVVLMKLKTNQFDAPNLLISVPKNVYEFQYRPLSPSIFLWSSVSHQHLGTVVWKVWIKID